MAVYYRRGNRLWIHFKDETKRLKTEGHCKPRSSRRRK